MSYSGVFIAPVTPVKPSGQVDLPTFESLINYLLQGGVDGICVGGATSEYPHFDLGERKELLAQAARQLRGKARLLVSIGSSTFPRVLELGRFACDQGAEILLLPMPHFFRYEQRDLEQFSREVSRRMARPCFLYNIPFFTAPLEPDTSIRLLVEEPNITGIKDSSGNKEALARLVNARRETGADFSLFIGKDALIYDSLEAGWDGIISGLTNLCPELIALLYRAFRNSDRRTARACQDEIDHISSYFSRFPVPWAIRFGLEVRGIPCGSPPLPVATSREADVQEFRQWFEGWLNEVLPDLLARGETLANPTDEPV